MDEKLEFRQYSVKCLKPGSVLVRIHKSNLAGHVRRNPAVLQMMIDKWNELVAERMANNTAITRQTKLKS